MARSTAALAALPEIDGPRLHRHVERLAGAGRHRAASTSILRSCLGSSSASSASRRRARGRRKRSGSLAKRLISPANLAHWAEAWEAISEAKPEAFALNLDRGLLVLETWFRLQHRGAGTSCLAREASKLARGRRPRLFLPPWQTSGPITSPPPSPIRTTRPISAMPMRPWRRTRLRASGGCRAATCSSSPGPTSTASRCCRRRKRKASPRQSLPTATRPSSATWSRALNCSNDDFIRTREERHARACQELWRRMQAPATSISTNMPAGTRCATRPITTRAS